MGLELKEALRGLCLSYGWSYAVCWRVKSRDSILLMWEDAYYEEQIGMLVEKMLHQVHLVGEGIIGKVAFTGKHRWIFSDAYYGESSPIGPFENQVVLQDTAEWHRQFLAGIKTIAIVAVSPQIVVQFGSNQKILERLEFVDHAKSLFQQMQSAQGTFLYEKSPKAFDTGTYDSCATFASIPPCNISSSYYENIKFLDDDCKELTTKAQCGTIPTQYSTPSTMGLHHGSLPRHGLAAPVLPRSTCATKDSRELLKKMTAFSSNSSISLVNQCQKVGADCQVISSTTYMQMPHVLQQSYTSSTSNSDFTSPSMTTWSSDVSSLTSMEQELLSGMRIQRSPTVFPKNSETNDPCGNMFRNFQENSILTPFYNTNRTVDAMHGTAYGTGKLADTQHTSPLFHVAEGSPFLPQLPKELASVNTFLGGSGPIGATFDHSNPILVNNLNRWTAPPVRQVNNGLTAPTNDNLLQALGVTHLSSGFVDGDIISGIPVVDVPHSLENSPDCKTDTLKEVSKGKENSLNVPSHLAADKDLLDRMRTDPRCNQGQGCWDDIILPLGSGTPSNLSMDVPECVSEIDAGSMTGPKKGFFPDVGLEQLLDAVVSNVNLVASHNSDNRMSTTTSTQTVSTSVYSNQVPLVGCISGSMNALLSECDSLKNSNESQNEVLSKSLVSSWIDSNYNTKSESAGVSQPNRSGESVKLSKKRARPGESARPRPKDRQQIQDRVKELREIVPNGAKCSIDALLDRTIKHMHFLQSVTKYADKLKQIDEPKIIGKESGVVLKDASSGSGTGATWAFEVEGQTMVCPILVEDLNPPGQMLVEMLCEERGFFLEIADTIRGFGLTILKGVMEVRDDKIWARFVIEANRDVTRMDIFLSLVGLLQQTTGSSSSESHPNKVADCSVPVIADYQQSPMPIPISSADGIQ
ncbi:hypothetical protein MRB53_025692 [Persea americana]|uniref:Uncharacterized protein n=1 Tax=Persea americana TaxID=3435 RepID=A0ACC2LFZ6_PERAE|nr:hypothetical protein MRB53_025692 [Persea americana]|eukprot:TRINITY_DN2610_c1_g2_i1.p1 TRINITY_DN2610_c1_g2~~TRINITY_DN2610_c1_g2_i1.p1  ORF type:complete len:921 (+),score=186.85 TRINITY_DN2610_c1_g2_i1:429-3191(+)